MTSIDIYLLYNHPTTEKRPYKKFEIHPDWIVAGMRLRSRGGPSTRQGSSCAKYHPRSKLQALNALPAHAQELLQSATLTRGHHIGVF